MSVDGARKSENTHTHTRQPQEVGKKKSYVQNTVFSFFKKTDFVFGVWRK